MVNDSEVNYAHDILYSVVRRVMADVWSRSQLAFDQTRTKHFEGTQNNGPLASINVLQFLYAN
uniref:Uncharacterized protein n=1 Tax=Rhizophora mucronata TaxID=61149 RepID=A0A2P2NLL7_RHIMU